ncbi:MAG TPA: MopE-related protein [Candidatus Polarisedimenticolia bacterium]|nr:MopE-related protein [Candidatus Polarisedimenticolia bacterium]
MRVMTLAACLALAATVPQAARTHHSILTFEQRVQAQAAIERVYYTHQIGTTRPFEEAVPRSVLEKRVRTYLAETAALETQWKTPVTTEMLHRELERIAARTRMSERLRELYAALGDDPFLIEECLARPALVDRLARSFFAYDSTLHAKARHEAEALHQGLVDGRLDPWSVHPDRSVVNLVRLDDAGAVRDAGARQRASAEKQHAIELDSATFERQAALLSSRIGETGPVEEEPEAFVMRVVLQRDEDSIEIATFTVSKLSWEDWWGSVEGDLSAISVEPVATEDLFRPLPAPEDAAISSSTPCPPDNVWENLPYEMPDPRTGHTAVWTGSLMIVWGGSDGAALLNTGGRYDPAIGVWTPTSTVNAPSPRSGHTAVWTGSLMVVWGGSGNDGARYNPVSDTWTPMSAVNAPSPRYGHTTVWTGSRMIVWGGLWGNPFFEESYLDTGGLYDPDTDIWTSASPADAPLPRGFHTAVWTGTEMIVWGGYDSASEIFEGGRYDPAIGVWTPTSTVNAPSPRYGHTAVWTGSSMIVWGGFANDGGGRYDPASDTWTPISTANAPSLRHDHTAVWTGTHMLVWGGDDGSFSNTGGRYDPASDTWTPTSISSVPMARAGHSAIWTGSLMIVWGGAGLGASPRYLNSGGRYDPLTEAWTSTSTTNAPSPRELHTAVWTGNEMIVWGGFDGSYLNTGSRYDPVTNAWSPTSTANAPTGRSRHTSVWTGNLMVVWGGTDGASLHTTGGRYDPVADTWSATVTVAEPPRSGHTAVWTGSEMIVWGGDLTGSYTNTGGHYDPSLDSWTPTSTLNAPAARIKHTAVWADTVMIVWGGCVDSSGTCPNTGGRYNPATDTWAPTSTGVNVPLATSGHTAIWTGSEMIVWSGLYSGSPLATGGRYKPSTDTWTGTAFGPLGRSSHTAIWTGSEMVVWGGHVSTTSFNTGGRYYPAGDTWLPTSTTDAPSARFGHTAVWTGNEMIIWGGSFGSRGGRYAIAPFVDGDMDGHGMCQGDCDDGNAAIHPGAAEVCDNLDNDCNGVIDSFATYCGIGECSRIGACTAGVNFCVPGSPSPEVCDGLDNDCDGVADEFPPPSGSPVVTVETSAGSPVLGWAPLPDATAYDVVRGDLQSLISTGGDFTAAIRACLADDWANNTLALSDTPVPGAGYFYLVRGTNCNAVGTYDWGDPGQVGSRDAEIDASYFACFPRLHFCGDFVCDEPEESWVNCPTDCDFCPLCKD